jgi:hypothetical protein
MTPKQLHDLFRTQIADTIAPYLFSTDEIYEYMTDAQRMLCRLTEGIPDATSADVTKIDFGPMVEYGSMSPLVLTVRGAYRKSDGREIEVLNIEDFRYGTGGLNIDYDYLPGGGNAAAGYADTLRWRIQTGPQINAIILGMEKNKARCYPICTVGDTVMIETYRLPRGELTVSANCQFEVDAQHHRHLLLWMKSLAYAKQDVDIRDDRLAAQYEQDFTEYCEKARREQGRAKHKPRTVLYGGI